MAQHENLISKTTHHTVCRGYSQKAEAGENEDKSDQVISTALGARGSFPGSATKSGEPGLTHAELRGSRPLIPTPTAKTSQ